MYGTVSYEFVKSPKLYFYGNKMRTCCWVVLIITILLEPIFTSPDYERDRNLNPDPVIRSTIKLYTGNYTDYLPPMNLLWTFRERAYKRVTKQIGNTKAIQRQYIVNMYLYRYVLNRYYIRIIYVLSMYYIRPLPGGS